jgi:hypothetical protein
MRRKHFSPVLASLASVFKILTLPTSSFLLSSPRSGSVGHRICRDTLKRPFSSGMALAARKEKGQQVDRRVSKYEDGSRCLATVAVDDGNTFLLSLLFSFLNRTLSAPSPTDR